MLLPIGSNMSWICNSHMPWQYDLNRSMMSKPYPTGWVFSYSYWYLGWYPSATYIPVQHWFRPSVMNHANLEVLFSNRTLPPLYITFWSNKHNDMKDAIGVFKLKPFFSIGNDLESVSSLYLPIFFNQQWFWEFFLLSTYHFESTNIIMWKMQLGCSSSNHFFSISNNLETVSSSLLTILNSLT